MTTTYELYTNENGTPKAVEGKAPAILERVEALEGTLDNGVVRSVNGTTADTDGNVVLTKQNIIDSLGYTPPTTDTKYTLPNATSSVLGGVKIGSNITVSSGTISLSNSNVTNALGYTPLRTAPVTSVNGMTGAVQIDLANTKVNNAAWADNAWSATITPSIGFATNKYVPSGGTWACFGSYAKSSGDTIYVNDNYAGGHNFGSGSNFRILCIRIA